LVVYISRLYNESSWKDEKLDQFKLLYHEIKAHFEIYNKNQDLLVFNNSIIESFDKWFLSIHTLFKEDEIQTQYSGIVKGMIISKLNGLDVVKKTRSQITKTKKDLLDAANDNLKTIQKLSKDVIEHPEKVLNDGMKSMKEQITNLFKIEEESSVTNEEQIETIGSLDVESSFITETFIQKRVQKWVLGSKNEQNYYPTIIQFVDDYINDEYDIDLVSVKNKEKICQEISELKNKIEEDTKEIKYLLPKTYFDDKLFMENLEKENKVTTSH